MNIKEPNDRKLFNLNKKSFLFPKTLIRDGG